MKNIRRFAGCFLLAGGLGVYGCAGQKGDLGAERTEELPVVAKPAEPAPAAPAAQVETRPTPVTASNSSVAGEAVPLPSTNEKVASAAPMVVAEGKPAAAPVAPAPVPQAPPAAPVKDGDEKPAPTPPPTPAPAPETETPEQRAQRLLESAQRLATPDDMAKVAESDKDYETGLRLYQTLDYEEALKYFERSVTLNPANRHAQEYLNRTRSLLGLRMDRFKDKIQSLVESERVRLQEQLVVLANAMEEARQLEARGSQTTIEQEGMETDAILAEQLEALRNAQDRYRRVREILNWLPPNIDLPNERRVVGEALERTKVKIAEKEDEVQFYRRTKAAERAQKDKQNEAEQFKARISKMLDEVAALYNATQYRACEAMAIRVLQMDPLNSEAEGWKRKARAANHTAEDNHNTENAKEQRALTIEDMDAAHIPYDPLITYPPNWDEINKRTERAAIGKQKVAETWKDDVKKKLQRKVTFEFVDTPLEEAINFLRGLAQVTIIIDPKVLQANPPPVSLKVQDMTMQLALGWILKIADLDFALKDHAIYIAKKATIVEDIEMRIYDVSDLTQSIPDFPGPDFELAQNNGAAGGGGAGGGGGVNVIAPPPQPTVTAATLRDTIQKNVMPDSWVEGTSIEERSGRLVVMQRPEVHELIDQLMDSFRRAQKIMVNVESRFLTIREAYLENTGVDFGGLDPTILAGDFGDISRVLGGLNQLRAFPAGAVAPAANQSVPYPGLVDKGTFNHQSLSTVGSITNSSLNFNTGDPTSISSADTTGAVRAGGYSAQLTILDNPQMQAFVHALADRENTTTLIAPRLTVFNTQRAHMFVARQQSYVADYDISGDTYDPVIRQFLSGVVLDVRPIVSADRRYVTMELRPTVANLVNLETLTLQVLTTTGTGANPATVPITLPIQFPTLAIQRVRTTSTVPDGGIILLGGLYRNAKFNSENGVPFLSDLPVVGRLFRWNVVDNAKQNLAIMVSPKIILFSEYEKDL